MMVCFVKMNLILVEHLSIEDRNSRIQPYLMRRGVNIVDTAEISYVMILH